MDGETYGLGGDEGAMLRAWLARLPRGERELAWLLFLGVAILEMSTAVARERRWRDR